MQLNVKLAPLVSGLKISSSDFEITFDGYVTLNFEEEVKFTSNLSKKDLFEKLFTFDLTGGSAFEEYGIDIDFISMNTKQVKFKITNMLKDFTGKEKLVVNLAKGLTDLNDKMLIISKEMESHKYFDTHSVKLPMQPGFLVCDSKTEFKS